MPYSDKYISNLIDEDHNLIKSQMIILEKEIISDLVNKNFLEWKHNLRRKLITFKTTIETHFELEEEIGFKHHMFVSNAEDMKTIRQFNLEHKQILGSIIEIIQLQREMKENDDLRLKVLQTKLEALTGLIRQHEKNETQMIANTIKDFKKTGRFDQQPTHSPEEIEKWEKELNISFPETYKKVVTSGSYDKATFHFIKPEFHPKHKQFLVFASWNDVSFAFDTGAVNPANPPIYILMDGMNPENRYDDFTTWFHLIFELASQPVSAG